MKTSSLFLTPILCLAIALPAVAGAVEGQLLIDAESVDQSFAYGDADIDAVTVTPTLSVDNWSLSLSVPWLHIEGRYFVNNRFPNLAYLCNQLTTLSPAAVLFLISRDVITPAQVAYCNQQTGTIDDIASSYEGLGDIDLFSQYLLPPLTDSFSGSIGLGYKHDNGEYEEGLGTGTRELYLESGWLWFVGPVEVMTTVGYQFVVSNDTPVDLQDYAYGSLDLRWRLAQLITAGATWHYLQANAEILDDLDYVDWYIELGRYRGVSLRLMVTDYDEQGYPEEEYSANLSYRF